MVTNNFFTLASILYSTLLLFVFFLKERVQTIETGYYKKLIISNFFTVVTASLTAATLICREAIPLVNIIVSKSLLVFYAMWVLTFTFYAFSISRKNNNELKQNKILYTLIIISSIIIYALPLYSSEPKINGAVFTYGPSANFVYVLVGISIVLWIIFLLRDFKNIKNKKYYPLILLIILLTIAIIIQKLNPGLLLITYVETFVTFLMFFTIENPDVRLIEQLEYAKKQAEKANRAKTDFLSSMSHEIRTPLNAIVGFSECIVDSNSLEEAKEDAKDIVMASNNLLEIVNGILDISKIEADKMEIVNTEYNLREILENISKLIAPRINEKPIGFNTQFADDIPDKLYGDCGKIKQIITNILTNAAKYTEEGKIDFKVNCINEGNICKLVISVSDTGRGIKQEQIDKLFTKFERLEEDRNTTTEGTGLGLAITKRLIEMMGGKIVVDSTYGEGSTFTVYLKQEIRNLYEKKKEEKKEEHLDIDINIKNKKILAVDDNKLNLKVIKKLLSEYEVDLTTIESGFECLNLVENNKKFDLILMDIMMPKMGGVETLKKLKQKEGFNTPVIALTADAIQGKSTKYKEVGFDDYLAKPINRAELKRVLSTYINSNESVKVEVKNMDEVLNEEYLKNNDIDVEHGIELLGDINMYNDTLRDFLSENETRIPNMKEYKEKSDLENYAILAHALKSDSKYLGFKKLAELAYNHELNGKDNNADYINSNYDELMSEVQNIEKIVKKYLEG